ncbi:cell division protein FtsZ [Alteromonas mediterranea]|uniref:Cell division protein FtsZ n=2 Tax=Alteromonas mediterranea TaxID=314275 RepID=S5AD73_9ALTE|nr:MULTISPECIES: cell division protein FtsZ [Alteromonas]AEA97708.1 cell division protein FtsZ [Alteromonas mediterranea DE]AGP77685.1 putative cell division protein FtsZ [Alteromonas mediterranea 615]CAH1198127.1 Cell division protein FtsZ [Alteromonas mediterranea]|tara:strand:- start:1656 stop:2741 length:1086 start_codon:yes stop_codon:yes gene_type:complete
MQNIRTEQINIHVIGVGGCGGNAVSNMASLCSHENIRFSSVNTDIAALHRCTNHEVVLIGEATTKGYGAGADPCVASDAAIQSKDALKALIEDADLIIIIAGLGGGTGSGASPILIDLAKESDIDVMCFVTLPFKTEGGKRSDIARNALETIRSKANATLVMSNDSLLSALDETVGLLSAFRHCDTQMHRIVEAIIVMLTNTGYINVDINDFSHILSLEGDTALGVGIAEDDSSLSKALKHALENPLVDKQNIIGAQGVIAQLTCREEPSLAMYEEMLATLQSLVDGPQTLIITGVTLSPELPHFGEVLVIATGVPSTIQNFEQEKNVIPMKQASVPGSSKKDAAYLDIPAFVRLQGRELP